MPIENAAIVLELTCILAPRPWLILQPDIQWFIHPGWSQTVDLVPWSEDRNHFLQALDFLERRIIARMAGVKGL